MSTSPSPFGFHRLAAFLAVLTPLAAAAVEPPRDYALPLTILSDTGQAQGIRLVDAADFAAEAEAVPTTATVSQTHILYGGTAGTDRRPFALLYAQDGHWMRMSLRDGLSPVASQVSSESAASSACESTLVESTQGASPAAMLVYRLPGPDAACGGPDDQFRRIGAADADSTSPSPVPVTTLDLHPVYVNGALAAVFTQESGELRRYPASLASSVVVTSAATLDVVGQRADGTSFMVIDGALRKVTKEGTTPWVALKKPQYGYTMRQVVLVGTTLYIFEDALSASERLQTRVHRLDVDRSGVIVSAMLNLEIHSVFAGATDTRLLYLQGGGLDPVTSAPIPHELRSAPLDTNQFETETRRVYRIANGIIRPIAVHANRVFFNVVERGVAHPYIHGDARTDTGTALVNGPKGSAWLGGKPDRTSSAARTVDRLLLATDPTNFRTLSGAALLGFDPATLESTPIADLPRGSRPGPMTGAGAATLENLVLPADAFAIDLAQGRFRRLSQGGAGTAALR